MNGDVMEQAVSLAVIEWSPSGEFGPLMCTTDQRAKTSLQKVDDALEERDSKTQHQGFSTMSLGYL